MKSQKEEILDYIKKHGSITSYEAYQKLGITQLGARLDDLRKRGYDFKTEWAHAKRKGKMKYFKKYSFAEVVESWKQSQK